MEKKQNMGKATLLYLGHASVRIETARGRVIYIDPFAGNDYDKPADMILITHFHGDHCEAVDRVRRKEDTVMADSREMVEKGRYKSLEVFGIKVRAVPAYNANHKKSECVGYVLEFDGIKLYHAGDTSKIPEMADLAAEKLDYALLPMDAVYNMGPEEARECAGMIGARRNIPIHTGPDGVFSEENISKFNPAGKLAVKPGETILLERQ